MRNFLSKVVYTLTQAEKALLEEIVRKEIPPYTPEDYNSFMDACHSVIDYLPPTILEWSENVKSSKVGFICNLPVDNPLPPTPTTKDNKFGWNGIYMLSDGVIAIISALFGSIYTFDGKKTNRHIQNIYPIKEFESTQLAAGSGVDLEWHTEDAFLHSKAHWVTLMGLREEKNAQTKIVRASDLDLSLEARKILTDRQFKLRIDETFSSGTDHPGFFAPILSGTEEDPQIIFDPPYTIFQSSEEEQATAEVTAAANKAQHSFTLTAGDLLIFDNRRVMHARTAFPARRDGSDRWIKRTLIFDNPDWISKLVNGNITPN